MCSTQRKNLPILKYILYNISTNDYRVYIYLCSKDIHVFQINNFSLHSKDLVTHASDCGLGCEMPLSLLGPLILPQGTPPCHPSTVYSELMGTIPVSMTTKLKWQITFLLQFHYFSCRIFATGVELHWNFCKLTQPCHYGFETDCSHWRKVVTVTMGMKQAVTYGSAWPFDPQNDCFTVTSGVKETIIPG